jgi:hypothetical protein
MISLKMSNDGIVDFDNLLKKSYKELGIHDIENSLHHENLITIANKFPLYFKDIKTSNPYIIALKTIAYHFQSNHILMTKNKIYDFFVLSYKYLISSLGKTDRNQLDSKSSMFDNIIFEICDDVLNNYNIYEDLIKIQIPNLIVDVVAIVFFKADPYGKKVSFFQMKSYYMAKKESLLNKNYSYPSKILKISSENLPLVNDIDSKNFHIQEEEEEVISEEIREFTSKSNLASISVLNDIQFLDNTMISRITQITKRDYGSVKRSLSTLNKKEIKKLYDICNNYNKIIKYSKFDNIRDFKLEIEQELNRSLSDKQIRHSQISIKKVQFYMENLLDNKFEPHLTHGINHIKHNFEYGYRLVGLLKNSKSDTKK